MMQDFFGSSAMAGRVRRHDWAATPLGAIETWSERLRATVELVLASPLVSSVALLDDRLLIYNDAAARLYGDHHPHALGRPLAESFADSYPQVAPLYDRVFAGETVHAPAQPLAVGTQSAGEVFDACLTPVRDDAGTVIGAYMTGFEIGDRLRTDAALRESEMRLQQFGEASQDVLWIRNAETFQWEYLTPAFETVYGLRRDAALRGDNMAGWLDLVVPEDREHAARSIERVRKGEWVTFEYRIRCASDGGIRWLRDTDFPIQDASGKVIRIGGTGHDVTALKQTEGLLAAAEKRQRAILDGIPQLVWRGVDGGEWTWASPQWTRYTGQAGVDSHGFGWLDMVHPDDRADVLRIWKEAMARGAFEAEYRIRHHATGSYRWFQTRAAPVRDDDGAIVEWLGTSTDVDDLRSLQGRQQVLVAELQHRVRNILAVIRSIMRRSLNGDQSSQDYAQHLEGRVAALARTQVLLTRHADATVDLEELVRDELTAQTVDDSRVVISGPDVDLPPKAAEVLALAMHELATNALKYGAIAHPGASLRVEWQVEDRDDGRALTIVWSELGVPVAPLDARHEGFGTELITRRVPYELKGRGELAVKSGGIVCTISFPLADRASILETGSAEQIFGDRT